MKSTVSIFEYARMVTRIEEEILMLLTGEEWADSQQRKNPPSLRPSQVRPQDPAPRVDEA
jgi:hypothetical protein